MSGVLRPEQHSEIAATDDPDLARQFGLTQFNRETGQWEAPTAPDAGQRDGTDVPGHEDYVLREDDEAQQRAARDETLEEHEANAEGANGGEALDAPDGEPDQAPADGADDSK